MTSSLTLRKILRKAPNIHVFDNNGVTVLMQKEYGAKQMKTSLSRHSIIGEGTQQLPFEPRCSIDVNPHNVVVDLWLQSLSRRSGDTNSIFIKVNDWVLKVESDGVTSEDDCFTRLLPDK